jgi:hypothetical protein
MNKWQPIETAPKDGTVILLLSNEDEIDGARRPAKCALGYWHPKGTAWCDQYGRFPSEAGFDEDTMALHVTGVWFSGGGWFQPDDVTHWQPLPEPPQVPA